MRLRSQWRSLSAVVGGVLLTAVIGANIPLYTTAVAQVGMVQRLEQQPANQVNIFTRVSFSQNDAQDIPDAWNSLDNTVRQEVKASFDPFLKGWAAQTVSGTETEAMFVVRDGVDIENLQMHAAYYDQWMNRVRIISGTLPVEATTTDIDMEAALAANIAAQFNIHLGDVVTLDQRGWETSKPVRTRITALIEADDPADAYWMDPSPLRLHTAGARMDGNLLTTRESVFRIAGDFVPQTASRFSWRILFNQALLPFDDIPEVVNLLNTFAQVLPTKLTLPPPMRLNPVYETSLPAILLQYQNDVGLLNVFFALLLVQLGGLVLFFLVVIVGLVRRSERREVAMLQSRGAFDSQIILMRSIEAFIICLAASVVAPFIAQQVLTIFAPLLTHVEHLPLNLSSTAFFYAGITAVLALLVLIGTLRPILRLPLIYGGGSAARGEKSQWWQRYYLDVVLIIVGGAALLRLTSTDSPLTRNASGGLQGDPLLLLAPALLFIALGSLLLRLFPVLTGEVAKLFARRDGLRGALAAWQISREPAHHARIAFLLVLAIGVGWFATSFQATVEQSQLDQSRYRVGSDVRLNEHDAVLKVDRMRPRSAYETDPDVIAATTTFRINDLNLSPKVGLQQGTFLAVDPVTFTQPVYWRDDLGQLELPVATDDKSLEIPVPGGVLPITPAKIGLWVKLEVGLSQTEEDEQQIDYVTSLPILFEDVTLWTRLHDSSGTIIRVPMQAQRIEGDNVPDMSLFKYNFSKVATDEDYAAELKRVADLMQTVSGWVYFEGTPPIQAQGETHFDSFYWKAKLSYYNIGGNFTNYANWRMTLADPIAIGTDNQPVPFGDITGQNWTEISATDTGLSSGKTIFEDEHPNGRTAYWHMTSSGRTDEMGILFNYPELGNIPAVVSRDFAEQNTLQVGTQFSLYIQRVKLEFEVVNIVDYFPTLYADQAPFVVGNLNALLYTLNRLPSTVVYPNEVWLRLQPGIDSQVFINEQQSTLADTNQIITSEITVDQTLNSLQVDPLSLGLIGLLFVAFGVALLLSIVCLLTYTALNAQSRRAEFAVLRALGVSSRRVVMSVALEQLLVMAVAIVLGVVFGLLLSRQVLPTLAIGTSGGRITPPFVINVKFAALAQYALVLIIVLGGVILSSVILISRLSLASALRYGEE